MKTKNKTLEPKKFVKDLDSNAILMAEYEYAAQSAFQANEDRVKVFNFIFANILTLGASFIAPFLNLSFDTKLFGYIFLALAVIGVLSVVQLIKLRRSWRESVKAMNRVKEYYIQASPDLESAFKWRIQSIPSGSKIFSLSFIMAFMLMVMNTLAIIAAFMLLSPVSGMLYHAIIAAVSMIVQLIIWFITARD